MSKIAAETAATIANLFSGQTVNRDEISAQITLQYAMAKKRIGVGSYFQVFDAIEAAGATAYYTEPNYRGDCFYTFPAVAA